MGFIRYLICYNLLISDKILNKTHFFKLKFYIGEKPNKILFSFYYIAKTLTNKQRNQGDIELLHNCATSGSILGG